MNNVSGDGSNVYKIILQPAGSEKYVGSVHVPFVSTDVSGAAMEAYNIQLTFEAQPWSLLPPPPALPAITSEEFKKQTLLGTRSTPIL